MNKKNLFSFVIVALTLISLTAISSVNAFAATTEKISTGANIKYICGDVNFDGDITVEDVTLIQMHIAKIKTFDDIQLQLANFDNDTVVGVSDVTMLQMYIANIVTYPPLNSDGYRLGERVEVKGVLTWGKAFNEAVIDKWKPATVTFSKWCNYSSMFEWEDGIIVDECEKGLIRAFKDGDKNIVYVLSDSKIYLNTNCSDMFEFADNLNKVNFYNTDATYVTTMHGMFYECNNMTSLYTKGLTTPN